MVNGKEKHLQKAMRSVDVDIEMLRSAATTHIKFARNSRAYSNQKENDGRKKYVLTPGK
jgi:hypothetical protein